MKYLRFVENLIICVATTVPSLLTRPLKDDSQGLELRLYLWSRATISEKLEFLKQSCYSIENEAQRRSWARIYNVIWEIPDCMFLKNILENRLNDMIAMQEILWKVLKSHDEFVVDKTIDHKLLISVASDGYLRREK